VITALQVHLETSSQTCRAPPRQPQDQVPPRWPQDLAPPGRNYFCNVISDNEKSLPTVLHFHELVKFLLEGDDFSTASRLHRDPVEISTILHPHEGPSPLRQDLIGKII
jgi:hypothetical protein